MIRSHKTKSTPVQEPWWHRGLQFGLLAILTAVIAKFNAAQASQELLPHICASVNCPELTDINCPEDSEIRETSLPIAAALLNKMGATDTSSSPTTAFSTVTNNALFNSTDLIHDDIIAQCCLTKKCICKTCYIPDCHNENEVVVEVIPESMDTPGYCCGQYDCQREPNCTEVQNTENYWLNDCQRCKCYYGERICHQSCDEGNKKSTAICNSKALNTFFENGDVWKAGCYECECVNGEEKCVMPFCRSVNCPTYRQVIVKGSCCPICWPKGIPMPNGDQDYDGEDNSAGYDESAVKHNNYDEDDDETIFPPHHPSTDNMVATGNEIDTLLPDIHLEKDFSNTAEAAAVNYTNRTPSVQPTLFTKLAEIVTTSKPIAGIWEVLSPNTTTASPSSVRPCISEHTAASKEDNKGSSSGTYKVLPKIVSAADQSYLHYTIIVILITIVIVLAVWNVHLRAKQRSYRPVSNFDDNCNKMSSNIKKMNDYV